MSISNFVLPTPDDIAAFFLETTGMVPGYRQLSRGNAPITYQTVDLEGVSLLWCASDAHALWRDEMTDNGGIQFGYAFDAGGEVRVRGAEIDRNHVLMWVPGGEMEYLFKGPVQTLEIWISPEICACCGWSTSRVPLVQVPDARLDRLTSVAREATDVLGRMRETERARKLPAVRARLLDVIEPVLATWLEVEGNGPVTASESRQYAIFREAERCFTAGSGDQFTVDSLADAIGVSRRSLYYAFNASIGVGPRRYFEVQRLHWMREELLRSRPDARTVTEVATELEIGDLGRLAARYRELFGEYPSQSLARV